MGEKLKTHFEGSQRKWLCKTLNVYDTNLAFKKIYVAFDEIPKKMNWSNFLIYHHYSIKAWSAMHQIKLHQLRSGTPMMKNFDDTFSEHHLVKFVFNLIYSKKLNTNVRKYMTHICYVMMAISLWKKNNV